MGPEQDTFHRGDLCLKAGRHCDVDVASVDRKQVICLAKWRVSDLGRRVRWEIQISSGIRIAQEMCETMRGPGNCGEHVMRRSHLSLKSISTKILLQLSPFFFLNLCLFPQWLEKACEWYSSDTVIHVHWPISWLFIMESLVAYLDFVLSRPGLSGKTLPGLKLFWQMGEFEVEFPEELGNPIPHSYETPQKWSLSP